MAQNIDLGGNTIICNNIKVGATGPGQSGTDISATEIGYIDAITPGTVTLSKAVVVDANKDISAFRNVTGVNYDAGASGTAGSVDVFPTTASKGKIAFVAADSAGNTTTTITNASQAGAVTYTIPDAGASASFVLSTGTSTGTSATSTELTTLAGATSANATTGKVAILGTNGAFTTAGAHTLATGTTAIAPLLFTSGTNLTTATAGALEFDGNAFYATAVASSRQQLNAEQFVVATADSATYNNTLLDASTAAPVFTTTTSGTAAGAVTLVAGKTYFFEFMYNLTNTGTTSHTWATLFAGSATFTKANYAVSGVSFGTASTPATGGLQGFISSTTMSTPVVVTAASTSATEQVQVTGFGTFIIANAGTIIPSMKASARPGASGTPGVIVLAGSFFRIWEMSSTAAVGNWS